MTPWLSDPDVDIYVGDALDVLRGLPDGSVDCCVTSPPYWGLRDYGTGQWDGGEDGCDHQEVQPQNRDGRETPGGRGGTFPTSERAFRDVCGKCGAQRVDRQLGLEATPDLYVAAMVAVFAEVRRVLADHGTLWLNIGDSYASPIGGNNVGLRTADYGAGNERGKKVDELQATRKASSVKARIPGLKPKDLCGIPWRLAFALQADGWWLRSDIIWAKPNPMPESVTDRPTKAHEYVFLLSKRPSYWFDQEAVREPSDRPDLLDRTRNMRKNGGEGVMRNDLGREGIAYCNPAGRNVRSVWEIATQPYPDAHFATFPEELPRRCILAGCPEAVCSVCGKARERIVEATGPDGRTATMRGGKAYDAEGKPLMGDNMIDHGVRGSWNSGGATLMRSTAGWSDCGHGAYRPGVVLDPFLGSGTTAHVARKHGRRCVGIELNETYAQLAARRLQQLSLLAEGGHG